MKTVRITSFGKLTSYGKWYEPSSLYQINRLYYVHSGSAEYYRDGERHELVAGSIYFIPQTEGFSPIAVGTEPFVHSYADFSLISLMMCDKAMMLPIKTDKELELAVSILLLGCERRDELRSQTSSKAESFLNLFESAVSYLVNRIAEENGADFINDNIVTDAISIMNRRIGENLAVRDIAEELFMSEDGFIRRFSRVVGCTPYAYLKKLRLRTAESMLSGGEPIAAVAESVGYSDSSALLHALSVERRKVDN